MKDRSACMFQCITGGWKRQSQTRSFQKPGHGSVCTCSHLFKKPGEAVACLVRCESGSRVCLNKDWMTHSSYSLLCREVDSVPWCPFHSTTSMSLWKQPKWSHRENKKAFGLTETEGAHEAHWADSWGYFHTWPGVPSSSINRPAGETAMCSADLAPRKAAGTQSPALGQEKNLGLGIWRHDCESSPASCLAIWLQNHYFFWVSVPSV